jgi:cytochrome c-type biogenesis protein CcmH/NrfG
MLRNPEQHSGDLWEMLGDLADDQALQVLTELFARYEHHLQQNPQDPGSASFFRHLAAVLHQVRSCNVNRR